MNVVFNTSYPYAASASFYTKALEKAGWLTINDYQNYDKYDYALFMSYPRDLAALLDAKKSNPDIKVGVLDPRSSKSIEPYLPLIDFFIVDSIEMRDFFAAFGKPILRFAEYPDFQSRPKNHQPKDKIIIAYHGNKVHLAGTYPHITHALEILSQEHNIELQMIYNIEKLGKLKTALPRSVPLQHIQWHENIYTQKLSEADIGIAPAIMPLRNPAKLKRKAVVSSFFLDSPDDYLLRFKMPSNPGRIIVFAKLGIPVIADFYPSALQIIKDGQTGLLANSAAGWYNALERLTTDHELRQRLSDNMRPAIEKQFDYDIQNQNLLNFLENFPENRKNQIINTPDFSKKTVMKFRLNTLPTDIKNIFKIK